MSITYDSLGIVMDKETKMKVVLARTMSLRAAIARTEERLSQLKVDYNESADELAALVAETLS